MLNADTADDKSCVAEKVNSFLAFLVIKHLKYISF